MKVLIAESYKAIRTGDYVSPTGEEFVFDSDDCELSKAVLTEIAKKNKVTIGKKDTAATLINKLAEGLASLKLPEQNQMSDSDVVKKIVAEGTAAGKDDETMIIEIISKKIKYKAAIKMFNAEMTDGGYRLSNAKRKEQAREILIEAEFEPEDYAAVTAMIEKICKDVPDTETSQAHKLVRAYCKEFEIELPKPDKKPKGGFRAKVYDFIIANPTSTEDELKAFIVEDQEKEEKVVARYVPILELAQKIAASFTED